MESIQSKTKKAKNKKAKQANNKAAFETYLAEIKFDKWALPAILALTFLAYSPAFFAQFVNWDDGDYSFNNILIRNITDIKGILTTPIQGNYHPLTIFTLAINWIISGNNAWSYHLFNVVFHLINCVLVFRLAMLLSNRNGFVAFTTAVLFGIHPMHVESVAWVSERKDVLYGLFFVAALIAYTRYVDTGSKKQYIFSIVFGILSLLSKPAAVVLPGAMLCIDFLRRRELSLKLFLDKVPITIPAFALGYVTYIAQKTIGAATTTLFPLTSRIFMGFYGIAAYAFKMIFPFNLATFYGFPPINESLPITYYISPLFFVLLAIGFYYSYKKSRLLAFAIAFYLVNLILVLQFLTVGSAIIADRYSYMPYIGWFFLAGWLAYKYMKPSTAVFLAGSVAVVFTFLSFKQATTWLNGASLWDQAIKVAPSYKAYLNRATLLKDEKNYEPAIEDFSEAIRLNPQLGNDAYIYRGNVYFELKKYDLAFNDYQQAMSISRNDFTVLHNIGVVYAFRNQYDSALKYYSLCLAKNAAYKAAYNSRGVLYMNHEKFREAIVDFQNYLRFDPKDASIYNIIGTTYRGWLKQDSSLKYINKAIEIDPDPHYILNRAMTYGAMNNYDLARKDVLKARASGVPIDPAMLRELKIQ
jgi:protein O-mannosyl-transferase